jgi:hypothetical protein
VRSYDDFTEHSYEHLLADVGNRYQFGTFLQQPPGAHVIWRHDIDLSSHRALSLARIEAGMGIRATYFVRVRSPFYNIFERPVAKILKEIAKYHDIGLHAEPVSAVKKDVAETVWQDRRLLEDVVGPIRSVSFHNPTVLGLLQFDNPRINGLVNAISEKFTNEYEYVSDSGGCWRRPIHELLDPAEHPRLHVNTHPEWWTEVAMSRDHRILRGINGRADASWRAYMREVNARFGAVICG